MPTLINQSLEDERLVWRRHSVNSFDKTVRGGAPPAARVCAPAQGPLVEQLDRA